MTTHYNRSNVMTLLETTRQRLGFKKGDMFEPTPNVRNPHMMEEAEAFAPQLRAFERAVRDYHRHVQGFLGSLIPLLEENLPRVWTSVAGSALAEPVRPQISHGHPSRIGGDFSAPLILERLEVLNRSMEDDILAPLRRWQEGLGVAKERMRGLEHLRRDVDKQRHASEKSFRKQEGKLRRAYLGAGDSSSSSDSDFEDHDRVVPRGRMLEDYQRLALHTERHLNALMASYTDQERLLWEQLSGLVTDAAWLESYAAAAMLKVKEAMQAVALALGPCKQPLPAFRHAAYPFEGTYGQIGHNIELVKAFGPRARELASGAKPVGAEPLPYTALKAKRGLSTPLMVAAAARPGRQQQALALQPVPPVQVGAHAIPLEAVPSSVAETAVRRVEERALGTGTRVADAPGLPPALQPTPGGSSASRYTASALGGSPGASPMGNGAMSRGAGTATATTGMSTGATNIIGTTTGNRTAVPISSGIVTSSGSRGGTGIIQKAAETAGAAVGGVAGAARGAAAAFREGEVKGEMAGDRDVERAAEAIETGRERISDTAAAVTAPITGHGRGVTGHGYTSESVQPTAVRFADQDSSDVMGGTGISSSAVGGSSMGGTGVGSALGGSSMGGMGTGGSALGGSSMGGTGTLGASALGGSGYESCSPAMMQSESAGPMASAAETGGINGVSGMSPMAAGAAGAGGVSAGSSSGMMGGSGLSGVSAGSGGGMLGGGRAPGSTGGMLGGVGGTPSDDIGEADLDSYVSAIRPSNGAGLKSHRLPGTTAAPAGFDEINPIADEYATPHSNLKQQQGGGGMMGAMKRAVGM